MVTLWLTSSLLLKIMFKRGKSTISMCNFHWQTVKLPESSITTLYCEIFKIYPVTIVLVAVVLLNLTRTTDHCG
jgi:hypothetical protein